jgi:hypothetical protein
MTLTPAAIATARRNVAQRIERFLASLERDGRLPNRRDRFYLREALEKLATGQFPTAEEAMLKAERSLSIPEALAEDLSKSDRVTVVDLRAQLDSILKEAR